MSEVIYLSNARLSFPNLVEPQVRINEQTGEKRTSYNCELIMPEQHSGYQQFMQRFAALAQLAAKENAGALMHMINSDRKSRCYGPGAEKVNKKTFQPYDGYVGNVFITCGSNRAPQMIRTEDGKPVDPMNTMEWQAVARRLYGGCRVNAAIKPWWQNPNPAKQVGHGIRCDLIAIQFAADDNPFGEAMPDVTGLFGATAAPAAGGFVPAAPQMPAAPFGATAAQNGGAFAPPAPQMPAAPFAGAVPGLPPFMTGQ